MKTHTSYAPSLHDVMHQVYTCCAPSLHMLPTKVLLALIIFHIENENTHKLCTKFTRCYAPSLHMLRTKVCSNYIPY